MTMPATLDVQSAGSPPVHAIGTLPEVSFYLPAPDSPTRPRFTLKQGDTFIVIDSHGDLGVAAGGADGLFRSDTRFLSRLALRINGAMPLLLGCNIRDDNSVLTIDLTNPDFFVGDRIVLQKDTVHIVRTIFIWGGAVYQRLGIKNYGDQAIRITLAFDFASDFADIFEVRGLRRPRRGLAQIGTVGTDEVRLRYKGLDGKTRQTGLVFDPPPLRLEQSSALLQFELAPDQSTSGFLTIACDPTDCAAPVPFFKAMVCARRELKAATRQMATVDSSNQIFNEVLCRSMADLYMLMTASPDGPFPCAGIPWYATTFGRDGLITALEMLWFDPGIARGVLKRLASYQATTNDDVADAQPGKILHEMRFGEMAVLHEVPFGLYYGSVDATPLFVMLAGLYVERTGDPMPELWPAIEAALRWIDGPGDPDGDGFVEYQRANAEGLINQGWKDSYDAVFHSDGSLAPGPIALAEVQGYVFAAKQLASRYARRLGREGRAIALAHEAELLADRFDAAFWYPDLNSYALALDGGKRPCRVRTSNPGQLLFTGIVRPERAAAVAQELLQRRFFSGWGIRTVASGEARYNPMAYHNGSIWPHDNALIALGFARYGHKEAVAKIFTAMFDAATYMDLRRLPELFCGFQRRAGRGPTLYPVACSPQAWAAGVPFMLLQASLGLEFDPAGHEIRLCNPSLPSFLDDVTLRNLKLGAASVDLAVYRHNRSVSVEVLRQDGPIRVAVTY